MRTEGGGVGIAASLFRPRSSVLRYTRDFALTNPIQNNH
jgi:hypothetical protein